MSRRILVIGAGPAGLMAAIKAAEEGASVVVFESMPKPARKLGISGKGRGNITNTAGYSDFLAHFNNHGRFLKTAFKAFFNQDLLDFFAEEGLKTTVERGGRVFTASGKAPEIVSKLVAAARKRNVTIITDTAISDLVIEQKQCKGVKTRTGGTFDADAVIIATGGKSYPLTGSTGDGYKFAQNIGHKVVPPLPSLVALKPERPFPISLNGLQLRNIEARLIIDGKKVQSEFGELAFLDNNLAGPVIITLSRTAVPEIVKKKQVIVSLDLKPALDHEKLDKRLLRDLNKLKNRPCSELIAGLLPTSMIDFCLESCEIDAKLNCSQLEARLRKRLRNWLKELSFEISEPGPWSQAIVTAGGIDTREINPVTMQSKLVSNLFFAGEIIDIDADTGGFNLQAAFSTGWLAGFNAARDQQK